MFLIYCFGVLQVLVGNFFYDRSRYRLQVMQNKTSIRISEESMEDELKKATFQLKVPIKT